MTLSKRLLLKLWLFGVAFQHLKTFGSLAQGKPCEDKLEDCSSYFDSSQCGKHNGLTRQYCPRTCDYCEVPSSEPGCKDLLSDCASLIESPSQCQSAKIFFTKYCPRTCGLCGCDDILPDCLTYITNVNQCQSSPFFAKYCRKFCGFCEVPSATFLTILSSTLSTSTSSTLLTSTTKSTSAAESSTGFHPSVSTLGPVEPTVSTTTKDVLAPGPIGCSDTLPGCPSLVEKDPKSCDDEYMKEDCPKSCKLCDEDCKDKMPKDCMNLIARDKEFCKTRPEFMKENCARSCDYCGCSDLLAVCPALVLNNKDYCDSNRLFMKTNCPRSCDFCANDIRVKPPTQKAENGCVDKRKRCEQYASYKNYCRYHFQFMSRNCPKACNFCEKEYNFAIRTEWNGAPIDHAPITFQISAQDSSFVQIHVSGPFFDDPGSPPCQVGSACDGLWDYEVAEVFFLGKKEKYLEIELSPHGQHLLLMLNGVRKKFMDKVHIEYSAIIDRENNSWTGTAKIPIDYFPPDVSKINAYAIHGSGVNRRYESLYPASSDVSNPDFHRLEFFKPFDFGAMFTMSWSKPLSPFWKNNVKRIMRARAMV